MNVRVHTLLVLVLRLLRHQLLIASLPLVIRIDVDPFIGDPFGALGDDTAAVQSVFVLLAHPTCWRTKLLSLNSDEGK